MDFHVCVSLTLVHPVRDPVKNLVHLAVGSDLIWFWLLRGANVQIISLNIGLKGHVQPQATSFDHLRCPSKQHLCVKAYQFVPCRSPGEVLNIRNLKLKEFAEMKWKKKVNLL